jgi:hypothetical protein
MAKQISNHPFPRYGYSGRMGCLQGFPRPNVNNSKAGCVNCKQSRRWYRFDGKKTRLPIFRRLHPAPPSSTRHADSNLPVFTTIGLDRLSRHGRWVAFHDDLPPLWVGRHVSRTAECHLPALRLRPAGIFHRRCHQMQHRASNRRLAAPGPGAQPRGGPALRCGRRHLRAAIRSFGR